MRNDIKILLSISVMLIVIVGVMGFSRNNTTTPSTLNVKSENPTIHKSTDSTSVLSQHISTGKGINGVVQKTKYSLNGKEYVDFSVKYFDTGEPYGLMFGKTGVVLDDDSGVYVFIPVGGIIYGLKYDHYGNLQWSYEYNVSTVSSTTGYGTPKVSFTVKPFILRMTGRIVNGKIVLLFEDISGKDFSMTINPNDGSVQDSTLNTVPLNSVTKHFDIWTFNRDGLLHQSFGRIMSIDLTKYNYINLNYPYVVPVSNESLIIFNLQNKVTNGGYDYQVMFVNATNGLVRKSYFFGSPNNDYLYNKTDLNNGIYDDFVDSGNLIDTMFWQRDVLPGYIDDGNYVYFIVYDGIKNYLGFDIIKMSKDDAHIVWMKRYILPDLLKPEHKINSESVPAIKQYNYRKYNVNVPLSIDGRKVYPEINEIYDDGQHIVIKMRLVSLYYGRLFTSLGSTGSWVTDGPYLDSMRSAYLILKINKDDGKIPVSDNNNDYYDHGAVVIYDTSNPNGLTYIYDVEITPQNNVLELALVKEKTTFDGLVLPDGTQYTIRPEGTYSFYYQFTSDDKAYFRMVHTDTTRYLMFNLILKKLYTTSDLNSNGLIIIQDINVKKISG